MAMSEEPKVDAPAMMSNSEPKLETLSKALYAAYHKVPMDDVERLNDKIMAPLTDAETTVNTDMTRKVTVKMTDGSGYRAKVVEADAEYFPTDLIFMRSGILVMRFEPVDTREWDYIELGATQADQLFPELAAQMLKAHGVNKEPASTTIIEAIQLILEEFENQKDADRVREEYQDNPLFGIF